MRIRQHQRVDAEPGDLKPDTPELVGLGFAGKLSAVNGDRAERRRGAFRPHRIKRVAVDRDQFRAGFGAGRGQPLGCRRSVQPWIESEAVAGDEMLRQPGFRGGIDQRLNAPGVGIDLFCGLQRIAAIDEYRGFLAQHDRKAGRAGKAGQPGQPLFGRRDIFVLLLVGTRNHESGQLPARQFLAEGRQPRRQRDAAFGFLEGLEMGFVHRPITLDLSGQVRNASTDRLNLA